MCVFKIEFSQYVGTNKDPQQGVKVIIHDPFWVTRTYFIDDHSGGQELLDHVAADAFDAIRKDIAKNFPPQVEEIQAAAAE